MRNTHTPMLSPVDEKTEYGRTTSPRAHTAPAARRLAYNAIALIPVFSSLVCAVYVVLFYHQIQSMSSTMDRINDLAAGVNSTRMQLIIDNLFALEECVLKLPMC